jgi:hypothetical protein
MTQEQPGTITVPPMSGYVSRAAKRPRPDYQSSAWQTDLYYGTGEFGQKGKKLKKRLPSKKTEPVESFPTLTVIKRKRIKGLKPNAPPADANKRLVAVENIPKGRRAHGKSVHRKPRSRKGKA